MPAYQFEDIESEPIDDEYCYGHYAMFKVIMMKKNGYINVTKICQDIFEETKIRKEFKDWQEEEYTRELLREVSSHVEVPVKKLIICVTNDQNSIIQGTYAHSTLIPQIIMWASPKFAVEVSKIIQEYAIEEERMRKQLELKAKDDKIAELTKKLDELSHKKKRVSK